MEWVWLEVDKCEVANYTECLGHDGDWLELRDCDWCPGAPSIWNAGYGQLSLFLPRKSGTTLENSSGILVGPTALITEYDAATAVYWSGGASMMVTTDSVTSMVYLRACGDPLSACPTESGYCPWLGESRWGQYIVRHYNRTTEQWDDDPQYPHTIVTEAGTNDGHAMPAILADTNGDLHVMTGHHKGPIQHWKRGPVEEEWDLVGSTCDEWQGGQGQRVEATYVVFARDDCDNLHNLFRWSNDSRCSWQGYRRYNGTTWENTQSLIEPPDPCDPETQYNRFITDLSIDRYGRFYMGVAREGNSSEGQTHFALLTSTDGGGSWQHAQTHDCGLWVDFSYGSGGIGSYDEPFNTVSAGLATVVDRGELSFAAGTSSFTGTINQRVTLLAPEGAVMLGQ